MFGSVFLLSNLIVATLVANVEIEVIAMLLYCALNLTASEYLIEGKLLGFVPFLPVRNFVPLLRILKVFISLKIFT